MSPDRSPITEKQVSVGITGRRTGRRNMAAAIRRCSNMAAAADGCSKMAAASGCSKMAAAGVAC